MISNAAMQHNSACDAWNTAALTQTFYLDLYRRDTYHHRKEEKHVFLILKGWTVPLRWIHFALQKERLNASWDRRSYNSVTLLSIIKRTKVFRLSPTYSQLQQSRHGWWPLDTISGHLMQADINNEAVVPLWAAGVNSQRVWEGCSCSAL